MFPSSEARSLTNRVNSLLPSAVFTMFSYAIIDVCPQFRWWCLVTRAACGLVTPSLSSGLSTRCGSGCSRSWTCTRSMPPASPSKTLTWTAISSVAWATRTSSVLPAAWDTFSTTASQSSSGAVRLKVWEGIEGGGGLISLNKREAGWFECVWNGFSLKCCWGGITEPVRGHTAWCCGGRRAAAQSEGDDGFVVCSW